jgi:hypothetical protein
MKIKHLFETFSKKFSHLKLNYFKIDIDKMIFDE